MELTESLQDYLLEIYIVKTKKEVVRLKDIAHRRNVKFPSVVSAIKELVKRGLVAHEHYGYIEFTDTGIEEASKLYEMHKMLYNFLHNILGISEILAEKDAHRIEHDLNKETVIKLTKFVEFIEKSNVTQGNKWIENLHQYANTKELNINNEKEISIGKGGTKMESKLNKLKVGDKAKIVRVESEMGNLKARLLDMGTVPGTVVEVEKVAPLGDPIDILIKGYHLSLRKEEAAKIIVEVI